MYVFIYIHIYIHIHIHIRMWRSTVGLRDFFCVFRPSGVAVRLMPLALLITLAAGHAWGAGPTVPGAPTEWKEFDRVRESAMTEINEKMCQWYLFSFGATRCKDWSSLCDSVAWATREIHSVLVQTTTFWTTVKKGKIARYARASCFP